jgi:hypothetical protein
MAYMPNRMNDLILQIIAVDDRGNWTFHRVTERYRVKFNTDAVPEADLYFWDHALSFSF